MEARWRGFCLALLGFLVLSSATGWASLANKNMLPLGDREAFLGNAGVAYMGSSGGVYYNPANLASLKSSQISFSGSTFVYNDFNADVISRFDNTNLSFKSYGFNSIPMALVSTLNWDDWVFAFSVLSPGSSSNKNRVTWQTPNTLTTAILTTDTEELWVGVSAGRYVAKDWSLGISVFGMKISQTSTSNFDIAYTGTNTRYDNIMNYTDVAVYNGIVVIGTHYKIDEKWETGIKLQSPSFKVQGKADFFSTLNHVEGGVVTSARVDQNQIDANSGYPLDGTLGVKFSPLASWRILGDVSLQGSGNFDNLPGSTLNRSVATGATWRYNAGSEIDLSRTFTLGLGYYAVPSANQIPVFAGETKEDYHGATAGLYYVKEHLRMGVGGSYLWSTGKRMASGSLTMESITSKIAAVILTTSYSF